MKMYCCYAFIMLIIVLFVLFVFHCIQKQNMKKSFSNSILYLNKPIDDIKHDAIDVDAYVTTLMASIHNDAKMIALVSDYGGGKSSVISLLEKRINSKKLLKKYKFCRLNLWEASSNQTVSLHENFIYQLATSIKPKLGDYLFTRISNKYKTIRLISSHTLLSYAPVFILSILFYYFIDTVKAITIPNDANIVYVLVKAIQSIPSIFFVLLILGIILVFMLLSSGISISNPDGKDMSIETEIMNLYHNFIFKTCFYKRNYIVVVEDLDRDNDAETVYSFLRELKKYHNLNTKNKYNNVIFIICLKPEQLLETNKKDKEPSNIYPKLFDYTVILQKVNIDNYDAVLESLLNEQIENLKSIGIVNNDINKITISDVPYIEYIIRGEKIDIRQIKERLNYALTLYDSLSNKFDDIEFEKCIIASYIIHEYSKDYYSMSDNMFDDYLNEQLRSTEKVLENNEHIFSKEVKILIEKNLIDSDYRTYFFNYPKNSNLYSFEERSVRDIILKNSEPDENFHIKSKSVYEKNKSIIVAAVKRYLTYSLRIPTLAFKDEYICKASIESSDLYPSFVDSLISYFKELYSTNSELFNKTISSFIKFNIDISLLERLSNDAFMNLPNEIIIEIRSQLIKHRENDILKFKDLFLTTKPLICSDEINSINALSLIPELININHSGLHTVVLPSLDAKLSGHKNIPEDIFNKFFTDLINKKDRNFKSIHLIVYMHSIQKMISDLEDKVVADISSGKLDKKEYVELINDVPAESFSENTIKHIKDLKIWSGLNKDKTDHIYNEGLFLEYLLNAAAIDFDDIDFTDNKIVNTVINSMNEIKNYNDELFIKIRKCAINKNLSNKQLVSTAYHSPFVLISIDDLQCYASNGMSSEYLILLIDSKQITNSNLDNYINFINSLEINSVSYELAHKNFIFNLKDNTLIMSGFSKFDHQKYNPYSLDISSDIVDSIREFYNSKQPISTIDNCIKYMKTICYADNYVEKTLLSIVKSTTVHISTIRPYFELLNSCAQISNEAIEIIRVVKNIGEFKFSDIVDSYLLKNELFEPYVVSRLLKNNLYSAELTEIRKLIFPVCLSIVQKRTLANVIDKLLNDDTFLNDVEKNCQLDKFTVFQQFKHFNLIPQTKYLIEYLFNHYNDAEIKSYLLDIKSFKDNPAQNFIVEKISSKKAILDDKAIYKSVYYKLSSPHAKGMYNKHM